MNTIVHQAKMGLEEELAMFENEAKDLLAAMENEEAARSTVQVLAMVLRWLRSSSGYGTVKLTARRGALMDSFRVEEELCVVPGASWPRIAKAALRAVANDKERVA